ncbi:LamG-like jellyroll fold domain-containing protein [Flavobacterium oreochromis]|uniref:PKD domain-containing protein n=1 Tax=Flavobacterium columnare TaxID=996 RepID=A0A246G9N8_9FLAO|nr:LamG-like jellyroll fold domain-containing protein [Flavobacterium oreochromis]OWP76377.1 hypothetical protein BWK62_09820 [Flavobacterium oreochromis]
MNKKYLLLSVLLSCYVVFAQQTQKLNQKNEENEDFEYEVKHKKQFWFSQLKEGSNYFDVKQNYDKYFGKHKWEESKTRNIGEDWLKSKLYYLDNNGIVQPEPILNKLPIISTNFAISSTNQVGTWKLIGPVNSATTGYSGRGNHGGYVYLNRIDPTNSQKMFVSFVTGGLWVTNDGGINWTLTDSSFEDVAYNDIDVCNASSQRVYALNSKRLLKSVDGGLNWTSTTMTSANYSGTSYDIAASTTNPDIVITRWGTSLYRTIDGGTTWNSVQTGLSNYSIWDCSIHGEMLEWDSNDPNNVYFVNLSNGNNFSLYRSTNQGANFSVLQNITLDSSANGQVIGWCKIFTPKNNLNSIYVAVGTGNSAYAHNAVHLYKINKTTGVIELSRINIATGVGDPYAHAPVLHHGDIQMDRTDENKIIYGSYGNNKIHYSNDNGVSFTVQNGATHTDLRATDFVNGIILLGSDGEAVTSTDFGTTLRTVTNSISNHELWGFGSAFKSNLVASGNNHGPVMIKETYNGFDWYNGSGADQGNTDVNPLDDRYIYSNGYSNYRYFRTGPHTLINESNYLDNGGIYSYFNQMEFHPNKYYTLITHHAGQYPNGNPNLSTWKNSLIKTEDNGASVRIIKTFTNQVFREKISVKNSNTMIVVEGLSNNKLWKTTDDGLTWTNITPSLTATINQTNISDIAIGDENPNEIWVTYSGVQTACKIVKSIDGGVTWMNLTNSILTSSPITKIIYQRGSNGGVYVANKAGVFYRNNTMSNWAILGNGLPTCEIRFMHINYNENKLKIGTSRGAFEHDLYEISPPNALISVNTNKISCGAVETLKFKDYSVIRNASATWQWNFPGGTPSTSNEENPVVSYAGAPNGFYNVTLTITDAYGTSTQTLPNFIEVNNVCGTSNPDKIPGNSVNLTGNTNADYVLVDNLNLNKNAFTFSCWIKPNGIQPDYSAIFMSQNDPNAFGLNFLGGNNSIGFHPTWSWNSGLQAPAGQWSYVALVSNGTNVKIYVNGKESVVNTAMSLENFTQLFLGTYGRGRSDRYTNMEMDEVCIWNRALTIDEIRKWRHLTKSISGDPILTGLVAYYQFNESVGNITLNKNNSNKYATYKGSGYSRSISKASIFEGVSEKINVNSAGIKDFTSTGLTLEFASGTYPNGDVWVSKGNINPDELPSIGTNYNFYTIVNNYGINTVFTPLKSISFYGINSFTQDMNPMNYKLFKRGSNDFGNTWGSHIDIADSISGSGLDTKLKFDSGLNITSFSQFVIGSDTALKADEVSLIKNISIYPNPIKIGQILNLVLPTDLKEKVSFSIYEMNGAKIIDSELNLNENKILLNIPQGLYLGIIHSQKYQQTFKLIVK